MTQPFVHLHLHTEYSIIDSTVRIPSLMQQCASLEMPAVALTDQGNLFGMVKFFRQALKAGVKPLVGVDLKVADHDDIDRPSALLLLCQNQTGYRNLTTLLSRTFLEGQHRGIPMAEREWLTEESCEGLIALSGAMQSDVGRALVSNHYDVAEKRLAGWLNVFGDRYYLELMRTGRSGEADYVDSALGLASSMSVPVVASNDVRFMESGDFESHEARVCIQEGRTLGDPDRLRHYSEDQYLKSSEQMAELFDDVPEALSNAWEIAKRCNFDLKLGQSFLPAFPVPRGQTTEQYLKSESASGLETALERKVSKREIKVADQISVKALYKDRLATELAVICDMGFAGYFLIVADFIRWAKEQRIPVGPGRGSGAGSLVAWALGITDIDPLEHHLRAFRRF